MTHRSHPLPFPVRDATDLHRAIRYARTRGDASARRYVISRARALGHADLLPNTWTLPVPSSTTTHRASLDQQFEEKAKQHDISVAKLKTVYFRGVEEYQDSGFDMGTPTMWGLARVQRFINAVSCGAPLDMDADLLEVNNPAATVDPGIDIVIDPNAILADVLYASGEKTAEMFEPADVYSISFEDGVIEVGGSLDGRPWAYTLDTVSGEHNLSLE